MARGREPLPEWAALAFVAGALLIGVAVFLTFGADWYDSGSVWDYADQQAAYPPWSREAIAGNDRALRRALVVGLLGLAIGTAPLLARGRAERG
jgi:hypothetical protein